MLFVAFVTWFSTKISISPLRDDSQLNMIVFQNIAPCALVEVDLNFSCFQRVIIRTANIPYLIKVPLPNKVIYTSKTKGQYFIVADIGRSTYQDFLSTCPLLLNVKSIKENVYCSPFTSFSDTRLYLSVSNKYRLIYS